MKKCEPFQFCVRTQDSQHRYRAQSESDGPRAGNGNALRHRVCSHCRAFRSLPPARTDVPLARRLRSGLCICVLSCVHGGRELAHFFTACDCAVSQASPKGCPQAFATVSGGKVSQPTKQFHEHSRSIPTRWKDSPSNRLPTGHRQGDAKALAEAGADIVGVSASLEETGSDVQGDVEEPRVISEAISVIFPLANN